MVSALNDPKGFQDFLKELTEEYIKIGGEGKKGLKIGNNDKKTEKKNCCSGKK